MKGWILDPNMGETGRLDKFICHNNKQIAGSASSGIRRFEREIEE